MDRGHVSSLVGYPNVNTYASPAGSRKVISSVRSADRAVLAHELVQAAVTKHAVPALIHVFAV
jgi:hypothetical protein